MIYYFWLAIMALMVVYPFVLFYLCEDYIKARRKWLGDD